MDVGPNPKVEVGFELHREWWGRGLATETALAALRFGFAELDRIIGVTAASHAAARRVMEKAGLTHQGTRYWKNPNVPVAWYAIDRGAWNSYQCIRRWTSPIRVLGGSIGGVTPELLAAVDAFLQQHRRCGELDGGVDDERVCRACECGPLTGRRPSEGALNDKQDEYLRDIYASGQHLLSLINDILDLSKIEAGRMELAPALFHLPTALENAVTLVRERAGRHGIALHLDLDPRIDQLVGDERKVKQVVLNLLSNAVKFTPEGGRISVKAGLTDGAVEIAVTDTGIGIAQEDQAAIFEEFRQVGSDDARKQEGTGLGLTLAKKFVALHGGRIWVESDLGRGSTFTFTLPVS